MLEYRRHGWNSFKGCGTTISKTASVQKGMILAPKTKYSGGKLVLHLYFWAKTAVGECVSGGRMLSGFNLGTWNTSIINLLCVSFQYIYCCLLIYICNFNLINCLYCIPGIWFEDLPASPCFNIIIKLMEMKHEVT